LDANRPCEIRSPDDSFGFGSNFVDGQVAMQATPLNQKQVECEFITNFEHSFGDKARRTYDTRCALCGTSLRAALSRLMETLGELLVKENLN
jgi:hypothetical protein